MFCSLDYKLRGVGEQNLSLPSQEEETWPQGGLIQMAGDGPTHNERERKGHRPRENAPICFSQRT
jgi:hypothetical protein